ncbi:hypothetical protein [Thalassomonas actiniarum]|uniref:Uncharacterized protein n=1 Tax=Thalassomonas actiniarum TaxID=485447 RepID=A0AAF0BZH1_9GAMM|nr:hypothetical protein [Thalassomonas actiniarum]WDD96562.1 hypothetical protein SG35_014335 [Thalassomonas actiniarum]
MLLSIVLVSIWALLMFRSAAAEYKYYQSVKTLEPEIWEKLGSPKFLMIPLVFISPKGSKLLQSISNNAICELARRHRQAGIQFLSYVMLVLVISIVYFKIA